MQRTGRLIVDSSVRLRLYIRLFHIHILYVYRPTEGVRIYSILVYMVYRVYTLMPGGSLPSEIGTKCDVLR